MGGKVVRDGPGDVTEKDDSFVFLQVLEIRGKVECPGLVLPAR